jgi:hypothetical protein
MPILKPYRCPFSIRRTVSLVDSGDCSEMPSAKRTILFQNLGVMNAATMAEIIKPNIDGLGMHGIGANCPCHHPFASKLNPYLPNQK